jgi:hypothetical protein
MSPLSREAIFTALSGLAVLSCDKTTASAEPAPTPALAAASPAAAVAAKEVPSAAPSGSAKPNEKEKSCAPGGCAPRQCGGGKKK